MLKKWNSKLVSACMAFALAVVTAVAPVLPAAAATPSDPSRLGGIDQYDTAAQIAQKGWPGTSENVILAAGMTKNLVDALAAEPLAAQLNAPILLTDGGDQLNTFAKKEIDRLKPKNIFVTSGSAVIKSSVITELKSLPGVEKVKLLGGYDQYETSVNIAKELTAQGAAINKIVLAAGWVSPADALSVAPIAASQKMAILLTTKDQLPDSVKAYIKNDLTELTDSYVVGGQAVVSDEVLNALPHVHPRFAGMTKYDTNLAVLQGFASNIKYDTVYMANGETLVDALSGVPLAAISSSPIILTNGTFDSSTKEFAQANVAANSKVVAFGGQAVIPVAVLNSVTSYAHVKAQDFAVMQLSGVNGYNVGFALVDGKKATDLSGVSVSLYEGDKLLATNTATNKLLTLDTAQLSSPFNIDGTFSGNDGYWNYGTWNGILFDVPTKAVITVSYNDGSTYSVDNTNLAGNPEDLMNEALNHVQPQDFGVMQASGVNGYSVGFKLIDGKANDLAAIKVMLFKGDKLLAENDATDKLLRTEWTQISSPFNVNGSFDGLDGYWNYGTWQGDVTDIPDSAVVIVGYQNGRVYTIENTNLTGDATVLKNVASPVKAQDFGVMQFSGVNGYSVGFALTDGKNASDVKAIKVSLYDGDKLLAANTATNKLLSLQVAQMSSPFNINGAFTADGYWNYGTWNGTVLDVPTRAVIEVIYPDGQVYKAVNINLTGNPADLNKEALTHIQPAEFGVMQFSGVNGYDVGFSLTDGKTSADLSSIEISLYKGDTLLAKNTSTDKLLRLNATTLSSPFNIDGDFTADGYWNYGAWNGTIATVPTKAVIKVTYLDGRTFYVENTNLTGDTTLLGTASAQ